MQGEILRCKLDLFIQGIPVFWNQRNRWFWDAGIFHRKEWIYFCVYMWYDFERCESTQHDIIKVSWL